MCCKIYSGLQSFGYHWAFANRKYMMFDCLTCLKTFVQESRWKITHFHPQTEVFMHYLFELVQGVSSCSDRIDTQSHCKRLVTLGGKKSPFGTEYGTQIKTILGQIHTALVENSQLFFVHRIYQVLLVIQHEIQLEDRSDTCSYSYLSFAVETENKVETLVNLAQEEDVKKAGRAPGCSNC